jgi:hypothetical protein
MRRTVMHAWARRSAGYGSPASRGPVRKPSAHTTPRLAASPRLVAALALAAVAGLGCSSTALAAPAHLTADHDPAVGRSCSAPHGWAAITLADRLPAPQVTVSLGAHVVVTVPRWGTGTATEVAVAHSGILRQECTVVLPDRGRRTIFLAARTGSTRISATVEPASNLFMPAWMGEVTVRSTQG